MSNSNQPCSTKKLFVVTYHFQFPDISKILRDLHPILESSERCKNAIKSVPFVAFRKPKSLEDYLVHEKVDNRVSKNLLLGSVNFSLRRCEVCKYMDESSHFRSLQDDRRYSIN